MKKLLLFILVLVMSLALLACTRGEGIDTTPPTGSDTLGGDHVHS